MRKVSRALLVLWKSANHGGLVDMERDIDCILSVKEVSACNVMRAFVISSPGFENLMGI